MPKRPYGEYGVNKLAIEQYLTGEQDRARQRRASRTHQRPRVDAHRPRGQPDPGVIDSLRRRLLPGATAAARPYTACTPKTSRHSIRHAWTNPKRPPGRASTACAQAFTLRGYAEVVARHFGHEPRLEFVPWDEFVARVDAEYADTTLDHIGRAPLYSMEKARTVLGFHDVTNTVLESIDAWVAANRN